MVYKYVKAVRRAPELALTVAGGGALLWPAGLGL